MICDLSKSPHNLLLPTLSDALKLHASSTLLAKAEIAAKVTIDSNDDWEAWLNGYVQGPLWGRHDFLDEEIVLAQLVGTKHFLREFSKLKNEQFHLAFWTVQRLNAYRKERAWDNIGFVIFDDDIGLAGDLDENISVAIVHETIKGKPFCEYRLGNQGYFLTGDLINELLRD